MNMVRVGLSPLGMHQFKAGQRRVQPTLPPGEGLVEIGATTVLLATRRRRKAFRQLVVVAGLRLAGHLSSRLRLLYCTALQ